jgi:type IV pilus assembly protein PilA
MLSKLRRRAEAEQGFTLIELLVVILIIGILAAIAIPSFINQRSKAQDASTKSAARTAQTAIETYATDNNGDWTGATETKLNAIEPTIALSGNNAVVVDSASSTGYKLHSTSSNGDAFYITRVDPGTFSRTCTTTQGSNNTYGGCVAGAW